VPKNVLFVCNKKYAHVPCMAFFNCLYRSLGRNHPLGASLLLSTGRWDAAVWASRLRSGNFVWHHVLHMGLSTGCRALCVACFWFLVHYYGPVASNWVSELKSG
jgi:hypothetical protein